MTRYRPILWESPHSVGLSADGSVNKRMSFPLLNQLCVPRTPSVLITRPNRLTSAAMIALLCFFLTPVRLAVQVEEPT
jgi:hypothetical protein